MAGFQASRLRTQLYHDYVLPTFMHRRNLVDRDKIVHALEKVLGVFYAFQFSTNLVLSGYYNVIKWSIEDSHICENRF